MTDRGVAVIVLFLCLASRALAQDAPQEPPRAISVVGREFQVWQVSPDVIRKLGPARDIPSSTMYLHLAGSRDGMFPRSPGDKRNWMSHRAFATLGQRDSESFGTRATCMVFKRPALTKHVNYFSISDYIVPNDKIVEEERLYLTLAIGNRAASPSELRTQFMTHPNGPPGRQVCLPAGTDLQSLEGGIFVSADMTARFYHNNALAVISANFTDVKDPREFDGGPTNATAPLEAAVYVRDFLDRAFPEKDRILFSDGKLIETFDAQKKSLNNGEEIRLQISFGLDALRMTEIVRLRATSGSFRREGADVFYKAAQPGKQTITLEAISGTHWDGKVDYAEQRKLEITVE